MELGENDYFSGGTYGMFERCGQISIELMEKIFLEKRFILVSENKNTKKLPILS